MGKSSEIREYTNDLKVLEAYHNPEGIDIDRVQAFLQRHGVPLKNYFIVNEANRKDLVDKIVNPGIRSCLTNPEINAFAEGQLNICIVLRDKDLEDLNTPVITEQMLVQEAIHLANTSKDRIGFIELSGQLNDRPYERLEEAAACYFTVKYRREYLNAGIYSNLGLSEISDHQQMIYFSSFSVAVPAVYCHFKKIGSAIYKVITPRNVLAYNFERLLADNALAEFSFLISRHPGGVDIAKDILARLESPILEALLGNGIDMDTASAILKI